MTLNLANLFLTPQSGGGNPSAGPNALQALGGGTGVFATAPGLDFLSLILGNIADNPAQGKDGKGVTDGQAALPDFALIAPGQEKKAGHSAWLLQHLAHKISQTASKDSEASGDGETSALDYTALTALLDSAIPATESVDGSTGANTAEAAVNTEAQADIDILFDDGLLQTTGIADTETADSAETVPAPVFDELKRKNFFAFIENLLKGIPQENRPLITKITPGFLRQAIHDLRFKPQPDGSEAAAGTPAKAPVTETAQNGDGDSDASPALIATGLTPESLTKFIDELLKRTEQGESFIVGLVKILPPQAKREIIFLPRALVLPRQKLPVAGDINPGDINTPQKNNAENSHSADETGILPQDIAAQLNALTVGGDNNDSDRQTGMIPAVPETGFDRVLKVLELAQQQSARNTNGNPVPAGLEKAINNAAAHNNAPNNAAGPGQPGAGLSTFAGQFAAVSGLDFASGLWDSIYPDGFDWSQYQAGGTSHGMSLNGPAMMTSLVNHAAHAAQPHPATQMVAATITKAAIDGQKNITIRLDPPDLGRVEIRMEFNKDKHLKVHLAVEKNETYLMLQRDAHVLERTLQDAGIDMGGNSLSFELAQDGGLFDHGSDGNGNGGGGSDGPGAGNGEEEIIEARMDWYVDPETGLTRYDLLV